jgi:hypothetical protein
VAVFDPLTRQAEDLRREEVRDPKPLKRSGSRLVVGREDEEDRLALVAAGCVGDGVDEALEAVADDEAQVRQKQGLPRLSTRRTGTPRRSASRGRALGRRSERTSTMRNCLR